MARKEVGPKFATEVALCEAFSAEISESHPHWTPYNETAGFDILLVHRDGMQIGIEAKLRLNPEVVSQSLPGWRWMRDGPDYRAALVPDGEINAHMGAICDHIGIKVLRMRHPQSTSPWYSRINMPGPSYTMSSWHPWLPLERCKLPGYVPDVKAGDKAPSKLSEWKIGAIRVQVILEERKAQKADIKALGLSPSRWLDKHSGFLRATPDGYVASEYMPDFRTQHPVNYAQIKADKTSWMPNALTLA
jgi:hypothetical protein